MFVVGASVFLKRNSLQIYIRYKGIFSNTTISLVSQIKFVYTICKQRRTMHISSLSLLSNVINGSSVSLVHEHEKQFEIDFIFALR